MTETILSDQDSNRDENVLEDVSHYTYAHIAPNNSIVQDTAAAAKEVNQQNTSEELVTDRNDTLGQ